MSFAVNSGILTLFLALRRFQVTSCSGAVAISVATLFLFLGNQLLLPSELLLALPLDGSRALQELGDPCFFALIN